MAQSKDISKIEDEKALQKLLDETHDKKEKDAIEKRMHELKNIKEDKKDGSKKPTTPTSPTKGGNVSLQRSPSAVKEMLLEWCKKQTADYPHVNVTNFSSSWSDGMAFCALVHSLNPKAFDFSRLDPKRRRGNFKLAFDVAEKLLDITPLLEVEDMVRMKNPDWKCVFTYVQGFYRKYQDMKKEQAQQA